MPFLACLCQLCINIKVSLWSIFVEHLWDIYNAIVKMLSYGPWWREKRKINTWIRYPRVLWGGGTYLCLFEHFPKTSFWSLPTFATFLWIFNYLPRSKKKHQNWYQKQEKTQPSSIWLGTGLTDGPNILARDEWKDRPKIITKETIPNIIRSSFISIRQTEAATA